MLHANFATLSRLLFDLGFSMRADPKSIRFDSDELNTWFLYPAYTEDEDVMLSDLVGTRYILDYKGIMSRDQFEERLKSIPVAS